MFAAGEKFEKKTRGCSQNHGPNDTSWMAGRCSWQVVGGRVGCSPVGFPGSALAGRSAVRREWIGVPPPPPLSLASSTNRRPSSSAQNPTCSSLPEHANFCIMDRFLRPA